MVVVCALVVVLIQRAVTAAWKGQTSKSSRCRSAAKQSFAQSPDKLGPRQILVPADNSARRSGILRRDPAHKNGLVFNSPSSMRTVGAPDSSAEQ